MTSSTALWLRFALGVVVAGALLATAHPQRHPGLPWTIATGAGLTAGLMLFAVVEHRPPAVPRPGRLGVRVWLGKHAALALWAGVEEIVWRWFVLGELERPLGSLAALGVAAIGFGVAHRAHRVYHVATGVVFGVVYIGVGGLAAAWVAHAAYNGSIAVTEEARRPSPAEALS